MQFKIAIVTLFAAMTMANPAIRQSNALEHPKLVGRPRGGDTPSQPSCCSYIPGECQASCCPSGCPSD
ncbi:hypothetical protein K456DRAFT_1725691 [Colletotrichum gloeosporioides 23]|nr:hypothetical protein K456DRAFT_1725691 [Colletotrichum gloeosporioides 23]